MLYTSRLRIRFYLKAPARLLGRHSGRRGRHERFSVAIDTPCECAVEQPAARDPNGPIMIHLATIYRCHADPSVFSASHVRLIGVAVSARWD